MTSFRAPVGPAEKFQMRLVAAQKLPGVGQVARMVVKLMGVHIPPETFTEAPHLPHVGPIVVHGQTRIGKGVTIFHNVTIGRGNIWEEQHPDFDGFVIEDGAVLCAGAAVLGTRGVLTVGRGTVVGANAVLTQSTGQNEVWAGNPARLVRTLADRPAEVSEGEQTAR